MTDRESGKERAKERTRQTDIQRVRRKNEKGGKGMKMEENVEGEEMEKKNESRISCRVIHHAY